LSHEGDEGLYNRANRSLYHFVENAMALTLAIALNGFVFPIPTFFCTMLFFVGRIIYTMGYTSGGYGKHVYGFIINTFVQNTLFGMLLLVSFKAMKDSTTD
jgi:hypothetical protein